MGVEEHISEELLASLHPLEVKALPHIKDGMLLTALAKAAGMQEAEATRALQWLESKHALSLDTKSEITIQLDVNGKITEKKNFPEMRVVLNRQQHKKNHPNASGAWSSKDMMEELGFIEAERQTAIGELLRLRLAIIKKENPEQKRIETTKSGEDAKIGTTKKDDSDVYIELTPHGYEYDCEKYPPYLLIKKIDDGIPAEKLDADEKAILDGLKKRKQQITTKERRDKIIKLTELGRRLASIDLSKRDFAERVTPEDIQTGAWEKKTYRAFDVVAPVQPQPTGKEHFVNEAIDYVRKIWLEMGFQEMEGDMVQSAFWNLDALFVPQDHPAREMQDTFYLDNPARTTIARNTFDRVKAAHEDGGGTSSKGWRYTFSKAESEQMLLRTHCTVVSAQTLYAIKEGKLQSPGKYFTVGKVFRNEALDWKHLFEFHQVEGIVVDPNVTFAQLIGYLRIFFAKMGFKKILLRPSYFPFTEPSVEIAVWNEQKKQWVELGGAGVFRPEVTKALLGEEVPVLAWGLGMERIVVEYFGLKDLRDIYKNDVKQLREMPRFIRM